MPAAAFTATLTHPACHVCSYLDDTVPGPGTYVYRVCDQDETGKRSGVCQKLVEIESASEQSQTLIIGGFIGTLAIAVLVAGIAADPIQTTDAGRAAGGFGF